ncbi:MAG: DUF3842 family protein [Spirochaetaceae bacterium]|jgi:3-oxoacyl-(acyl-carrier-protein) synthase|nr:DUF3842 family protein [Spirochaetaceae bacterium]
MIPGMKVIIVDGMGGGIGVQLIARLKEALAAEAPKTAELIALGTNSVATERMVKAGAHRGATGENAIRVSAPLGRFILGPIGIVITNSMMGEITPVMADAILRAPGERILLPLQNDHFHLAGLESLPLAKMMDKAVEIFRERLGAAKQP